MRGRPSARQAPPVQAYGGRDVRQRDHTKKIVILILTTMTPLRKEDAGVGWRGEGEQEKSEQISDLIIDQT